MIEKLYNWQKIFLVIIAILTILANLNFLNKGLFAFLIDTIFGVFINVFLFVIIFTIINWFYGRSNKEKQGEIILEIERCNDKAFNEARKKHPVGKALIGRSIRLQKNIIVNLNSKSLFEKDSFKIPSIKIPVSEEIKILDIDWNLNNYIIQTKNIKKGYIKFKEVDDELFGVQLEKQTKLQLELFNKYFKKLIEKYNLSKEESIKIRNKASLEILQRR